MKIAFVSVSFEQLGIEYLSACLKKEGHSVSLFFDPDLFADKHNVTGIFKRMFNYREKVIKKIITSDYDIVGFSVFSDYYGWACEIASVIKRNKPAVPIIFGGVHPTAVPDKVIRESFVDYVCVGEGEEAFVELVKRLEKNEDISNTKNIWLKKEGRIVENELRSLNNNLDNLPYPDKDIYLKEFPGVTYIYNIMTGRGCPHSCTFCHNNYNKELYRDWSHIRRRSVDNVIDELLTAKHKYRSKFVEFIDDIFISDVKWLEEFSEKYSGKIRLPYYCNVHSICLNKHVVKLLENSGCVIANLGIQSTDENIRQRICGRRETNEHILAAVDLFRNTSIYLKASFIFGLPLQDETLMIKEAASINNLKVDIPLIHWLRYYPRTKIIQIAMDLSALTKNEANDIENSKKYTPYGLKGSTYNKTGAKLINAIYVCNLMPTGLGRFIMKHCLWKAMPAAGFLGRYLRMISIMVKSFRKNFSYPIIRYINGISLYYFHFMLKRFR